MAKFYAPIGYVKTQQTKVNGQPSGVFVQKIVERKYYGDILKFSKKFQGTDKINDDINITNQLSILADDFATKNLGAIRYVTFMGTKWKVNDVEVQFPRLVLSLGGVYNG